MSGTLFEAAAILLPTANSAGVKCIANLAVTTSSQSVDLSTLFGNSDDSHIWSIMADMPDNVDSRVYVSFAANAAQSITTTATGTGSTVCWPIPDKQTLHGKLLSGRIGVSGMATGITTRHLVYRGLATGYLRIYRSSVLPGQGVAEFPPPT